AVDDADPLAGAARPDGGADLVGDLDHLVPLMGRHVEGLHDCRSNWPNPTRTITQGPRRPIAMNLRHSVSLGTLLILAGPAFAQDDAKAIVERAIAAHGGADKLDKFIAARVQSKGSIAAQGGQVPFVSVGVYQLPDKM